MNKKIALSGLSILASLALVGGVTFAAFSDSVTQTGNTFAVGTSNLQIAAGDCTGSPTFGDTIAGPTFTGLIPGDVKTFNFCLKNSGDTGLDLTADINSVTPADDNTQTIDNVLLIKWSCAPAPINGEFSPRAWLTGGNSNIGTLTAGATVACIMTGTLPNDADNSVAGQTAQFNAIYNGTSTVSPSPSPI